MSLKNDILNNLRNDKYYLEQEIQEILSDRHYLPYKEKVEKLTNSLKEIGGIVSAFTLVDYYIQDENVNRENADSTGTV